MNKQIKAIANNNSIWAICLLLIRSGANFFMTPYITGKVGVDAFGYISLANNFVLYIDLVCIAFNYFATRNISISYHKNDYALSNSFYSTILLTDALLFVIIGGGSVWFIRNIDAVIKVSEEYVFDVKILFAFILLKYFLTLFGSTLEVGCFIQNRLDLTNKIKTFSYFVYIVCVISLFSRFRPHVFFVGIASLIQTFIWVGLQCVFNLFLVPKLKLNFALFSFSKMKTLFSAGIWISINNLGNVLNDGLDLLLTNLMVSQSMVGMIAIAKLLGGFAYSIVGTICNSLKPKQLEAYSQNDILGLVKKLSDSMELNGMIFCISFATFICCGKEFFCIWLKDLDPHVLYILTILAFAGHIIPSVVCPLYYVYVLVQNVRFASYITLLMGGLNLGSMYLLLTYTDLGGYAVLLTTVVVNLIHIFDAPLYSAHCLKIDYGTFYKPILRYCCMLSCVIVWSFFVSKTILSGGELSVLIRKVLICDVPIAIYIIMYIYRKYLRTQNTQ